MSRRSSGDPDDLSLGGLVDEIIDQVKVALDEAEVTSRQSRDAMAEGLRDVLGALDPASLRRSARSAARAEAHERPEPDLDVVDGGLGEDSAHREGPAPDLRVVPEPEDAHQQGVSEDPRVVTRVVVKAAGAAGRPVVALPDPAQDSAWRSIFRGTTARPYRLQTLSGTVQVCLDGVPAETLAAGDTLDLEAARIQVVGVDGPAQVAWERLPS